MARAVIDTELWNLLQALERDGYTVDHKPGANRFHITDPDGHELDYHASGTGTSLVAQLTDALEQKLDWVDTAIRISDSPEERFKKLEAATIRERSNNPEWLAARDRAERQAQSQIKHNRMRFTFEYVDPKKAYELLTAHEEARIARGLPDEDVDIEINTELLDNPEFVRQRPLSKPHRDNLGNTLGLGDFMLTHQGVAIAADNYLLDGKHRLEAVLETFYPAAITIAWNVPNEIITVIDTGRPRSDSDVLYMNHIPNGAQLGAVARLLWWYDNEPDHSKWFNRDRKISQHEVLRMLRTDYQTLPETHKAAVKLKHPEIDAPLTVISALYYITTRADPHAPISEFWRTTDVGPLPPYWERLYPDYNLQREHPAYAYRDWVNNWHDRPGRKRRGQFKTECLIVGIRCYNDAREGKPLSRALFKDTYKVPSPYAPRK